MSSPTTPPAREEHPHWVEYPLSVPGELTIALTRTLLPMLAGVGILFALILAIGLVGEEGVIPSRELTKALDLFFRFAMVPLVLGGLAAWLLVAAIQVMAQVATGRALVRAADSGAPKDRVPHPDQLAQVTSPPGSIYRWLALSHSAVLGLFVVIGLPVLALNYFEHGWLVIAVPAAWIAVLLAGYWALTAFVAPPQEVRRNQILTHWPSRHRSQAEEIARTAQSAGAKAAHRRGERGSGRSVVARTAGALIGASAPVAGVGALFIYGALLISHPHAQTWPGGRLGDRGDLSAGTEVFVDQLVLWAAVLVVVGVAMGLLGTILRAAAHTREQRMLWSAVNDPAAERPVEAVLRRHSSIAPALAAQALAALSGAALCLGTTGIALATWDVASFAGIYRDANAIFGPLLGTFRTTITAGLLLFAAAMVVNYVTTLSGRDLRNALQARWPSMPLPAQTSDKTQGSATS